MALMQAPLISMLGLAPSQQRLARLVVSLLLRGRALLGQRDADKRPHIQILYIVCSSLL